MAGRAAAIDRDRGSLDVPGAFRAQEQRQRGDILRLAEAARVALAERLGPQLLDGSARRRRALAVHLLLPLGLGIAGMNHVDVDVIAVAELRQTLGEVGHCRIHRPADEELGIGRAGGAPTMLITLPCAAFNSGQNSRVSRTHPKNFSAKPSSQAASAKSTNAPARVAPALLTRTSQRRKRSLTRLNSCSHASSVRRSPATVNGCGPSAPIALEAAARFCSEEEASTVCAPSRAKASAVPRPIPRLAPEMTTTLSLNSPGIFHPPCWPVDTVLLCP